MATQVALVTFITLVILDTLIIPITLLTLVTLVSLHYLSHPAQWLPRSPWSNARVRYAKYKLV